MRRRDFTITMAGGLLPCVGLRAQQPAKPARIGILGVTTAAQAGTYYEAFSDELRRLGFVEGRDVVLEFVWAEGRPERYPALAKDMVARKVDVIFTVYTPAAQAAKQATSTIPIVVAGADPAGLGVSNVARPGGNVTGVALFSDIDLSTKSLELLKETRVATIGLSTHPLYGRMVSAARAAGRALRVEVDAHELQRIDDLEKTFAAMAASHVQAVVAFRNVEFVPHFARIANLAIGYRMPLAFQYYEAAAAGALFGYNADLRQMLRRAAHHVAKILRGAAPGDLPIEQPTHFILAVNLKTAKALGVTVPLTLLARADEVIE